MFAHSRRRLQPVPDDTRPLAILIDATLAERLAGVGIDTAANWLKLTAKERRSIWGITSKMVEMIDQAVRP